MDFTKIITSKDSTHFLSNGKKLFEKEYLEVLKFHTPGLAPVVDESGAYHIDVSGKAPYPERYDRTFGYYCNRASVVEKEHWFHITEKGAKAYTQTYKWTGNFQENVCAVRDENNRYYHIKLNGDNLYPETYVYAGDFKDGIACVKNDNGKFKHIDIKGNDLNALEFLDLGIFHKNFAIAKDEKGWFHIDKSGSSFYNERYLMIEPFYNGQALVTNFDGSKVVIDENGVEILEV